MYSVDLAAFQTFGNLPDARFFSNRPSSLGDYSDEHEVQKFDGIGKLADYEHIVFWGDFTTCPHYGLHDYYNVYHRQRTRLPSQIRKNTIYKAILDRVVFRSWTKKYLPCSTKSRVYSVGQNFQIINAQVDSVYAKYAQCYANFAQIVTRDQVSYGNLKQRVRCSVECGADVAFLVQDQTRDRAAGKPARVAVFFRRSKISNIESVLAGIERTFGLELVHFPDWLKPSCPVKDAYRDSIDRLAQCDFAISDTYHFIINATRIGLPAIGIGIHSDLQTTTTSDFKKKILFDELGIPHQYLGLDHTLMKEADERKLSSLVSNVLCGNGSVGQPNLMHTKHLVSRILGAEADQLLPTQS